MIRSGTLRDIRHAIRVLSKTPGFTTVATLTIALAIGMNAAMFSVVNALLLKRLPYKNAESIVVVWNTWPKRGFPRLPLFNAEFQHLRRKNQVFTDVAGFKLLSANRRMLGNRSDSMARAHAHRFSQSWAFPLCSGGHSLPPRTGLARTGS